MITIGRLFLIPPVLLWMDIADPSLCVMSSLVFMLAAVLDIIDGWLARRAGLVTVFGKFVDPLADKVMVAAVLVYLAADGRMPPWLVAILLTREFYINGLRSLASSEGDGHRRERRRQGQDRVPDGRDLLPSRPLPLSDAGLRRDDRLPSYRVDHVVVVRVPVGAERC
jgi:phosphatidylglycerophosphate synthase